MIIEAKAVVSEDDQIICRGFEGMIPADGGEGDVYKMYFDTKYGPVTFAAPDFLLSPSIDKNDEDNEEFVQRLGNDTMYLMTLLNCATACMSCAREYVYDRMIRTSVDEVRNGKRDRYDIWTVYLDSGSLKKPVWAVRASDSDTFTDDLEVYGADECDGGRKYIPKRMDCCYYESEWEESGFAAFAERHKGVLLSLRDALTRYDRVAVSFEEVLAMRFGKKKGKKAAVPAQVTA